MQPYKRNARLKAIYISIPSLIKSKGNNCISQWPSPDFTCAACPSILPLCDSFPRLDHRWRGDEK